MLRLICIGIFLFASFTHAAEPRVIYVSPSGNDKASGATPGEALQTPKAAAMHIEPGTVIRFDAGTYGPLVIEGKKGTAAQPIVIETVPGKEHQAVFITRRREAGTGIDIENCSYLTVRSLRVTNSQKGINMVGCSHCGLEYNLIDDLGQEAIHVGRPHSGGIKEFNGQPSDDVRVIGNTINGTGRWKAEFGEGVYIGTGAFAGDYTHHILIAGNTITDIGAEGIELKPGTHDVTVRGNLIYNTHHQYNAAITVTVEGNKMSNGNFLIEDNLIWNIRTLKYGVAGIAIGHGNAVIRNNLIWGVQGGIGIRVYQSFAEPHSLSVLIENNTIWCELGKSKNILLNNGGKPSGLTAQVQVKGTITADGSGGSIPVRANVFTGPLTGEANAGRGAGSGFQLRGKGTAGANLAKIASTRAALAHGQTAAGR